MNINKSNLRNHFFKQRKEYNSTDSNAKLNLLLIDFLEKNFPSNIIGAYYSFANEVDILPTIKKLYDFSIIGLPILHNQNFKFHQYTSSTEIAMNKHNIFEPLNSQEIHPQIVLTPLIAVDLKGNRLGYGKGYYDRYFALNKNDIIKIGICYNMQITESVPAESHDVPLDLVITETKIHYCG